MKKWMLIPIILIIVLLTFCQNKRAVSQELKNKLDSAIIHFQESKISEGIEFLIDGILLVKPSQDWPEGFVDALESAKEKFKDRNFVEGNQFVSEAFSMIQPQKKKSVEGEIISEDDSPIQIERKPAPLAALLQEKILSAKEKFQMSDAEGGIVLILEALKLLAPQDESF
jgi:hypothetical protein